MKVTQNPAGPQAQSLEQTKHTEKAEKAKAAATGAIHKPGALAKAPRESVEISEGARLLQRANELAHASPDIRAERVAALKNSIKDGSYRIDSASIADKLVDEHLFNSFGKNDL